MSIALYYDIPITRLLVQMTLLRATINHNYANVFFDGVHVQLSYDLPDVIPNHVTSGLFSKFYFPPYIVFCILFRFTLFLNL